MVLTFIQCSIIFILNYNFTFRNKIYINILKVSKKLVKSGRYMLYKKNYFYMERFKESSVWNSDVVSGECGVLRCIWKEHNILIIPLFPSTHLSTWEMKDSKRLHFVTVLHYIRYRYISVVRTLQGQDLQQILNDLFHLGEVSPQSKLYRHMYITCASFCLHI